MRNMTKRRRLLMMPSSPQGRLPTGFKEVEWLQGTGTQYCVTDVYPVYSLSNFTAIRGDFTVLDRSNSRFQIGAYWVHSNSPFKYGCIFSYAQSLPSETYAPTLTFNYGRSQTNNASANFSNFVYPLDVHFELNRNSIVHNGGTSTRTTPSSTVYTSTNPLIIGGAQSSSSTTNVTPLNTQTRFKAFKIYNTDTLLYEFVPCYRISDNKTGFMKITTTDGSTEFFPNQGTDEWIIGPVI